MLMQPKNILGIAFALVFSAGFFVFTLWYLNWMSAMVAQGLASFCLWGF